MKSDNSVSAWCRSLESQDFWKRWYHHLSVDVSFILPNTKSPSPCRNPQPFPPQVPPPSPIPFPDPAHTPPHPPQILPTTSKGQRGLHQIFPTTAPPIPRPPSPPPQPPAPPGPRRAAAGALAPPGGEPRHNRPPSPPSPLPSPLALLPLRGAFQEHLLGEKRPKVKGSP